MNTLETIIDEILTHDEDYPDHVVGCVCMDDHARKIKALMRDEGMDQSTKSKSNLKHIFWMISRQ